MNFLVRGAVPEDLQSLYNLSKQFSLLNLPSDKKAIMKKIETSVASFSGELDKNQTIYLLVLEDIESGWVAGSCQVVTKSGTVDIPSYSFEVLKKERFSKDLGVGFIHQILRLKQEIDGPTEVGGLIVGQAYRRRPEKVGKLLSLSRFILIGMNLEKFEEELSSEMAPPLTEEGRSQFWEALGRRFTGMPYQEADLLSQQNKEFIESLFPEEDIYLCLLDSQARLVLGRVNDQTQPALHLLERIGFKYKHEVDPFDGGPHLGVKAKDVSIIKSGRFLELGPFVGKAYAGVALVGANGEKGFRCGQSAYTIENEKVHLPEKTRAAMEVEEGDELFIWEVDGGWS